MSLDNGYITNAQFKASITPAGQTLTTDATDDSVISNLIERASREFDGLMNRTFYPRIETQYFDLPEDENLWFDDDLCEVITLTNGSATAIATADYHFQPRKAFPKYALYLTDVTDVSWLEDTDGSEQEVIALNAVWGFRENYDTEGWRSVTTVNGNQLVTANPIAVVSDDEILVDNIIRIGNEIMIVTASSSNDITVIQRGDNGSTAAALTTGTAVYVWQHPADITKFVGEMVNIAYKARFQPNAELPGTSYMTPAGVVTNPRALPLNATQMIRHYKRLV